MRVEENKDEKRRAEVTGEEREVRVKREGKRRGR